MSIQSRKRKSRLGKCDVCKTTEAIYTCPRCEAVTCSLACVKTHKNQLDCDGVRVRTKFIPVEKMNDETLLSDIKLLEDAERHVQFVEEYREHLERCQQEALNISSGPKTKIIAKTEVDIKEDKTVAVSEPAKKISKVSRKGRGRKRSNAKDSTALEAKSGSLVTKAKRIRDRLLKKRTVAVKTKAKQIAGTEDEPDHPTFINLKNEKEDLTPDQSSQSKTEVGGGVPEVSQSDSAKLPEEKPSTTVSKDKGPVPEFNEKWKKATRPQLLKMMRRGGKGKEKMLEHLKSAALTRNIALSGLPGKFQKHYQNTSYFYSPENRIYWHITATFLNAKCFTLTLHECAETMTLEQVIKSILKRSRAHSKKRRRRDPIEIYRKMGISDITVLMMAEKIPRSQRKFYELDMGLTLKENFSGKCVVEFPHLCIALKDCHTTREVKEEAMYNFLDHEYDSDEFQAEDELEKKGSSKRKAPKQKNKSINKRSAVRTTEEDRESGELTDSDEGENFYNHDSDSEEDSQEELFKETEFRSIYVDLLKSFETDVKSNH